jgi:hypothetical protein
MMDIKQFAEEINYFDTTVHPAKSLGEIQEMLEEFGVEGCQVTQGYAGQTRAWMIRFGWLGYPYRFVFIPLKCKFPSTEHTYSGKKRKNEEQAYWQMGRIALYFVKAILTAAEMNPHALFGFMEISTGNKSRKIPKTAGELNIDNLIKFSELDNLDHLLTVDSEEI